MSIWTNLSPIAYLVEYVDAAGVPTRTLRAGNPDAESVVFLQGTSGTQPTFIVWGRQNPFGKVPEADRMHEHVPGSQLVLFEECGHWPQHEQAAKYNPISLEFLHKATA